MLYFLYGENLVDSAEKLKAIKDKFLAKDPAGSGLSVLDYEEKERKQNFLDIVSIPNLLAPKRLIIVKNLIYSTGNQQEEVLEYLKKEKNIIDDKDLVIVFWEKKNPKKTNNFFKFLIKNAKAQGFEKPTGVKLNQWIVKKIKAIDSRSGISQKALEKLIFYVGQDFFSLEQEIKKLTNYAGGKIISEEEVDLLVQSNFDLNIFQTIDAIGNRNKKEALKFLHQHLKKGDDPFYIFSMLIYQFRNILKVVDLKENFRMSEKEISQKTKMHPFVVKKSLAQGQRFNFETLKKIYQKLGNFDIKVKTGKIDIRLALDKFIIEL